MADESYEEKTEPASGKKREEARERGQVARSLEMNSAFILMFGLLLLYVTGGALAGQMAGLARHVFGSAGTMRIDVPGVHSLATDAVLRITAMLAPVVVGLMVAGVAANLAQVGFLFSAEPLRPTLSRFNPLKGARRLLLSRRSLAELAKNLLKTAVVGAAAYAAVDDTITDGVALIDSEPAGVLAFMVRAALGVGVKTGVAFLVLAVLDYLYQRFEHERDLRMTRQEVKEETKSLEGDPTVRGRIRAAQRKIAYRRMMQDVPAADVVVTNPTHLAVALKYEAGSLGAPRVVAKGADLIAEKIKEIAREAGVPLVEDRPLAQALYRSVEIGEEIPEKLFQAVAQVLAYIYRLKAAGPAAGRA